MAHFLITLSESERDTVTADLAAHPDPAVRRKMLVPGSRTAASLASKPPPSPNADGPPSNATSRPIATADSTDCDAATSPDPRANWRPTANSSEPISPRRRPYRCRGPRSHRNPHRSALRPDPNPHLPRLAGLPVATHPGGARGPQKVADRASRNSTRIPGNTASTGARCGSNKRRPHVLRRRRAPFCAICGRSRVCSFGPRRAVSGSTSWGRGMRSHGNWCPLRIRPW